MFLITFSKKHIFLSIDPKAGKIYFADNKVGMNLSYYDKLNNFSNVKISSSSIKSSNKNIL